MTNNVRIGIKGVYKYNRMDKQVVFYFLTNGKVHKMKNPKVIEPLSMRDLTTLLTNQKIKGRVCGNPTFVYEDEVLEYDGRPLNLEAHITKMRKRTHDKFVEIFE